MVKDSLDTFKSAQAVADYIMASGWKISRASVFRHIKEGKLGKKKNGVYTLTQVNSYCRDYLSTEDFYQTKQDDELNKTKLKAEIAYKAEQAKLVKLRREVEEGKYVLRSDWALQLAGRAAVFETGLKGGIRSYVGDLIRLVDGDPAKTGQFISAINAMIDRELNNFTRRMEFKVDILTYDATEDGDDEES